MEIQSSNYYSVGASTNKGFSGMISGMDTENMVKQMLSGTQSKIDKQEALKQQTQWKQEIYRDVIQSINGFYGKYFDTSYGSALKTNFANAAFFNSMISEVKSGNAIKVTGTSASALTGEMRVAVKQLAAHAKLESSVKMSGDQKITGIDVEDAQLETNFSKKVILDISGKEIQVDLNRVTTESEMIRTFEQAFANAGITDVHAKIYNNCLRLVSDQPTTTVSLGKGSTDLGLKMTGLSSAKETGIQDTSGAEIGKMLQGSRVDAEAGITFQLTFDGIQKNVTLNTVVGNDGKITAQSVADALQGEVKRLFGDYISVNLIRDTQGSHLEFSLNVSGETGHELTVTGADAKKIGLTPGSSTNINGTTKLGDLGLSGERYSFSINGKSFTFYREDTISTLINTINSSDAGVKLSYSTLSDCFQMEATSSGQKYGINLKQQEGDLLSTIFGSNKIGSASSVAGSVLTTGSIEGKAGGLNASYTTAAASLTMNVNGKNYIFTLPMKDGLSYKKDDIDTEFNDWLKTTFGTSAGGGANISYQNGTMQIAEGFVVKFDPTKIDTENAAEMEKASQTDLALAFGFSTKGSSNLVTNDTPINQILQLNALDVRNASGLPAANLSEIASINGQAVTFSDGRLVLSGSGAVDLSGDPALAKLFGGDRFTFSDGNMAADAVKQGQNAVVIINGTEVSRSSNSITIDGISMELTQVSRRTTDASGAVTGYEETVIGTARDTESIVEGFKSFIKDYNEMLDKLNTYVYAEPNYRKYPPLTEAQKKEMSEREIELWEKKSKEGLVRRDDQINSFLSQMRSALYTTSPGSKIALYSIGIETTKSEEKGKLKLDESLLRNALTNDPDSVRNLFVSAQGLSSNLMKIMEDTAKVSVGSPGVLVQLAGAETMTATQKNNTLYRRITDIETRIQDLKRKYESERQRYWNQFNQMEQILASYNSQSGMIAQQFSGY